MFRIPASVFEPSVKISAADKSRAVENVPLSARVC